MPARAQKKFYSSLFLLILLNLIVKPIWIFFIDRPVQNITGFEAYGQYFSLLNLCVVFNFLLDMGISSYFNKEVASQPNTGGTLFSQVLQAKAMLGFVFILVVFLVAWITGVRNFSLLWVLVLLQGGSSMLLLIRSYLTGAQLYPQDAIVSVIDKSFVILIVGFFLLYPGLSDELSIMRFTILQLAGILIGLCVGLYFLYRHLPSFKFGSFSQVEINLFLAGLPFAVNIFLMTVISRVDGFMLDRLHSNGAHEAGTYAAGYRLLDAFNMVGFLVAGFLLPYIARHWPHVGEIAPVLKTCRRFLLPGSVWVASFAMAAPGYLANLLYGQQDSSLVFVLSVILLALPALYLLHVFGTVLTASGKIDTFIWISLVFAALSIFLNLLLIPAHGARASAVIAVAVQGLYAIVVIYYTKQRTGIGFPVREWLIYLAMGIFSFTVIRTAVYFGLSIPLAAVFAAISVFLFIYFKSGISFRQLQQALFEK